MIVYVVYIKKYMGFFSNLEQTVFFSFDLERVKFHVLMKTK